MLDLVADRTAPLDDQLVEVVPAVRRRGQAEPAADRDLLDRALEGERRQVVALVDDHQAVRAGELGQVGPLAQGRDVHDAGASVLTAADLAGRDTEELQQSGHPMVQQRFAVYQDERGDGVPRHQGAGDHGLAGTWRSDQHPQLLGGQHVDGSALFDAEVGAEGGLGVRARAVTCRRLPASTTSVSTVCSRPRGTVKVSRSSVQQRRKRGSPKVEGRRRSRS